MSCGMSCPCQLSCMMDTQGSKRDPVSSEKAWLDFAVRYLSREAVCKGKGQEAVWSSKCKPSWWDSVVSLPWKNPTANPKDTKEVLMQKYEVLSKQLRKEGRFPKELEEEAALWAAGKCKELFLLTSLSSVTGKATGLHVAVMEAISKADDMKAEVNQNWIQDIQTCLRATLKAIENLSTKSNRRGLKRPSSDNGKENMMENNSSKKCRLENNMNFSQVPASKVVSILPKQNVSELANKANPTSPPDHTKDVLIQLQKVLKKRKELSVANQVQSQQKFVSPKSNIPAGKLKNLSSAKPKIMSEPSPASLSPEPIFESEMISQNVPTKFLLVTTPETLFDVNQTDIAITQNVPLDSNSANSEIILPVEETDKAMSIDKNTIPDLLDIDFLLSPSNHDLFKEDPDCSIEDFIHNGNDTVISSNSSRIPNVDEHDSYSYALGNRGHCGRVPSNSSSHDGSELSDGNWSDSGFISDTSFIDSNLSPEEQNQIWRDDDIDGSLSNINIEELFAELEEFVKDI